MALIINRRNKTRSYILKILTDIIDPFRSIPINLRQRIKEEENKWLRKMVTFHYILWPFTFVLFFFVLDLNKKPLIIFAIYRLGSAATLLFLGLITYLLRNNTKVIKFNLLLASLSISLFICWSMTFDHVQSIWVIMHASLIMAFTINSMLFSMFFLFFIVVVTQPFWSVLYPALTIHVVHLILGYIILLFGHIFKKTWIQSNINKFLHDDAMQKTLELQLELHTEVTKFVPPVLVKKIEEQTQKDKPISIAIDDILRRHQNDVAVLFSDIRNFSQRSTDIEFVEKELIPSSIKLIDSVESNMGIAKQIGDAIFVYYSFEGSHPDAPKEAIIRAFKDAVEGCLIEKQRIKELGRDLSERFFSLTYGPALVGNMASSRHREATVIGSPANLAARMDSLTKEPSFKELIKDGNKILVSKSAKENIDFFEANLKFDQVNLEEMNLIMKSFPNEKLVYLFHITEENLRALNEILIVNELTPIDPEEFI